MRTLDVVLPLGSGMAKEYVPGVVFGVEATIVVQAPPELEEYLTLTLAMVPRVVQVTVSSFPTRQRWARVGAVTVNPPRILKLSEASWTFAFPTMLTRTVMVAPERALSRMTQL